MADDSTASDDFVMDPKENPVSDGHLPGPGEIGGPVTYHDPTTADTNDNPDADPTVTSPEIQAMPDDRRENTMNSLGRKRDNPGPDPEQIGTDPTIGS